MWVWSRSVMSDSLQPHGLQPTRFLHPWDFPGKNTGVGCHFLLQIFPTQGSNPGLSHCGQIHYLWATREAHFSQSPFLHDQSVQSQSAQDKKLSQDSYIPHLKLLLLKQIITVKESKGYFSGNWSNWGISDLFVLSVSAVQSLSRVWLFVL